MAIVKKYRSEVTRIENPMPDVYVVTFRSLDKKYKYLPGQFLHLALDEYDPSRPWPESRCFSMQSSDTDEQVRLTFAVKGAFTARMADGLHEGKVVYLKMPYGELFSRQHAKEKTVFIAGGTGITPYLSLFTNPLFRDYAGPRLYFGFRDERYHAIYKDDLGKARGINGSLEIFLADQQTAGMLDIDAIYGENGRERVYFISGPPVMIHAFKEYLAAAGVGADNIRTDDWE